MSHQELLGFLKAKDLKGWKAVKQDLLEFTRIMEKHPKSASAKDEDLWTPLHHLAARASSATEHHVQMFALLMQRVPECIVQKDLRGRLPQQLIKQQLSENATEHNIMMLDLLLAQKDGVAIGISMGLGYCCAAMFSKKADVIPNENGQKTTPTWVAFSNEILIGEPAKVHAVQNCENSIFNMGRYFGKDFQDPAVQMDLKDLPYKVINKLGGRPHVQVTYKGEIKELLPEQIMALVLENVKKNAEIFCGKDVPHCVIAVPAHYTEQQRTAAKQATTISGINVLRVINEPTAAAMAYGLEKMARGTILIYDLGAATFDVTLLSVEDGIFDVKSTAGDSNLGGADFDQRLATFCASEVKRKHKKDPTESPSVMRKILNKCEHAKKELSKNAQTTIEINDVFEGIDFYTNITRLKFEELCGDLFRATLDPVDRVLRNAKIQKSELSKIVLVGGSTRIPKIQSLVLDFFEGVDILKSISPDECIAIGAAIQAAFISNSGADKVQEQVELEVVPLTIGVESAGGLMTRIINRGDELPIKGQTFNLCTVTQQQPAILVQVYEGERLFARDNTLLGRFLLDNLECGARGEEVVLKLNYAKNGNVNIEVACARRAEKMSFMGTKERFSKEAVNKKVMEARQMREEDEKRRKPIEARNELESYAYWLNNRLQSKDGSTAHMSEAAKALLQDTVRATLDWLKANPKAELKETESKKSNLETVELATGKAFDESDASSSSKIERLD